MTGDLNFKTLMTLRMPEEGKAGFGLKKLRLSLIFSKTWTEYSQSRWDCSEAKSEMRGYYKCVVAPPCPYVESIPQDS